MKAVHARIKGVTASFKVPFLISGTQLCSPLPPYSTILGLLGCCAGREVKYSEVNIGFEYTHLGDNIDLVEKTHRLGIDKGILKPVKETAITERGFHVSPRLDLYLIGDEVYNWVSSPVGVPCLGRSQDIVWIEEVKEIELKPVSEGVINNTMIPFGVNNLPGRIMRFVEYYNNNIKGFVRFPGPSSLFTIVSNNDRSIAISDLYLYSDKELQKTIYIHRWAK